MEKGKCDLCGKEVGAPSMWQRVGFTAGSRVGKVCGTCYHDKLPREERLRFKRSSAAKGKPRKADAPEPEGEEPDRWPEQPERPPEELRF
jgi:ribosome-binding protein aMBF1 (putative translation factor)